MALFPEGLSATAPAGARERTKVSATWELPWMWSATAWRALGWVTRDGAGLECARGWDGGGIEGLWVGAGLGLTSGNCGESWTLKTNPVDVSILLGTECQCRP